MTHKLQEGREEAILDPELPIIDAHHHLFSRPGLDYLLDDYLQDASAGHQIIASVYVETRAFVWTEGPELLRPLGEVEFANSAGAASATGFCRACAAIIGYADLRQGDAVARSDWNLSTS
jgi:predicted TIM-barrel fold metal-dependent hydrolase